MTTSEKIEKFLIENDFNDSYGVVSGEFPDKWGKKKATISFCKARILDGVVKVYSDKFIQVKWQTAIRRLPHNHTEVFKSYADFEDAMRDYFNLPSPMDAVIARFESDEHAKELENFDHTSI